MTIKEIRQHKNNTIRQQIFTYLIHVRKEISSIDTRFFTVSNCLPVIYNSLDAYPAEMDTLQQFCIALARGVVSNHRIILVEDLEMMKNMKYIEDYLGILKILNQKKHITMILSMLNNQYLSLFDKFFYI